MDDYTGEKAPTLVEARSMLGQPVVATLAFDGAAPAVIARGVLMRVSDSGEIVICDEMGFCHWCWPMLDIAPDPDAPKRGDDEQRHET